MCKEFKIAQKTVEEFVHTKDRFTYNELSDEILKRSGVLAVAIGAGVDEYLKYFNELPEECKEEVIKYWGEPPGNIMVDDNGILIPGIILGNIFIGVQPSRPPLGNEDINSAIHDPTKPPHHQYIAFYKWIEHVFKADCIIHLGTHG